ncbi:MBL fold metallo-hydrolase [Chloroflexus sp.]|uniref:MBL fold metallo-hydrolase n=1 Tax=Chloroflexus sp. TaxID=1904827 RepID=UPI00260D6A3B|nr:MBL fold metallo-hydrolase [uncultured Chloroflexus sp.]
MELYPTPRDVALIDVYHLGRPHVISAFLLLGEAPALVDPGPASTLPALKAGLDAYGLTVADLRAVVLTHIHLDHAGATGLIAAENPDLVVHVHERGAPHLIDPSRLLGSAGQLYGDRMATLWGDVRPVASERIRVYTGGETLRLNGHLLRAFDAPGHAKHHLVWFDESNGAAFVGDNTGVRLPGVRMTRPATPPPDVDLVAWQRTHDLIEQLHPQWLCLTHFGAYSDVDFHLTDARLRLQQWAEIVRQSLLSGHDEATGVAALEAALASEAAHLSPAEQAAIIQQTGPLTLSWRGLARYWQKFGNLGAAS